MRASVCVRLAHLAIPFVRNPSFYHTQPLPVTRPCCLLVSKATFLLQSPSSRAVSMRAGHELRSLLCQLPEWAWNRPLFAMYLLSTYFVPDTSLALAHGEELGPATLESSTFSFLLWMCLEAWPCTAVMRNEDTLRSSTCGCRWRSLGLVSGGSNCLLVSPEPSG